MVDAPSHTRPLTQPTIAFHQQPTLAIGRPHDLARELFRQCDSSGAIRRPVASASSWEVPTVSKPRPQGRARAVLVCFACLLLGVGAGHAVREGSAYAATMGGSSIAARVPSGVAGNQSRDTHVVSSARAVAHGSARGKDVSVITTRAAARPARLARPVRPAPVRPAGTAEADALFIDFEPTFRVDR